MSNILSSLNQQPDTTRASAEYADTIQKGRDNEQAYLNNIMAIVQDSIDKQEQRFKDNREHNLKLEQAWAAESEGKRLALLDEPLRDEKGNIIYERDENGKPTKTPKKKYTKEQVEKMLDDDKAQYLLNRGSFDAGDNVVEFAGKGVAAAGKGVAAVGVGAYKGAKWAWDKTKQLWSESHAAEKNAENLNKVAQDINENKDFDEISKSRAFLKLDTDQQKMLAETHLVQKVKNLQKDTEFEPKFEIKDEASANDYLNKLNANITQDKVQALHEAGYGEVLGKVAPHTKHFEKPQMPAAQPPKPTDTATSGAPRKPHNPTDNLSGAVKLAPLN